ncbi:MAG: magnesium transporter CorA family protein [Anaeromyxobacteraceae bacterium]|nr:magnesium transporter CorA family protein [Anaeromyxobacteraceae bacterium]
MRVIRLEAGAVRVGGQELAGPGAPVWIDLAPDEAALRWLGERFGFHPLALEDCAHEDQRVKFDQYPDHLFTVVHRIGLSPDDQELVTTELNAFLTAEALVTVHSAPLPEVDQVFERCARQPDLLARGPDFALYLLHDAVTDVHFALVDALTEEVEAIAEDVQARAPDGVAERIAAARRQHALLRRRLSPQREVFAALARPGQGQVQERTAVYFRHVVDQVVRLTEEVDTGRDLLASTMDAALSQASNRLALVTTRLTLVATIFLPLNFVAGFFGMNLEILPARVAVPLVLSAMVVLPVGLYLFFRRKRLL